MLLLLARRAYAKVLPKLGSGASSDPWCGLGLLVEKTVGEGPERSPMGWLDRWPSVARQHFLAASVSGLLRQSKDARALPDMASLVAHANEGRKHATAWGKWGEPALVIFGVTAGDEQSLAVSSSPPARVLGVCAPPTEEGFSKDVLATLAKAKGLDLEVWAEIPAESACWQAWGTLQWDLLQRMGVATWFQPPNQEGWPLYSAFLEKAIQAWVRAPRADQWAWPLADLLEQGMEDLMIYGKPAHRDTAPWPWEGRCKNPDWFRLRKQVWAAAQSALGGEGALEEIVLASVLADAGLLVSFSNG